MCQVYYYPNNRLAWFGVCQVESIPSWNLSQSDPNESTANSVVWELILEIWNLFVSCILYLGNLPHRFPTLSLLAG